MKILDLLKIVSLTTLLVFTVNTQAAKKAKKVDKSAEHKANYEKKIKVNNDTIGVIAGVINYVCPKLVAKSTKICNVKDPVASAVGFQKQLVQKGTIDDLDDMEEAELKKAIKTRKILHQAAAMQFYDAVEQFKLHYPERKKAKAFAAKKKWQLAAQHEEMAWQYLVKTASRGIFTKKMVDGK
ncbi:MAG: hypothetical protein HOO06_11470 [Bdellovibrionaceae bacterium]|jgi:hypothetical protein|nr:hypothetical protein [Pseudobdellovibrionaceae bacterium]